MERERASARSPTAASRAAVAGLVALASWLAIGPALDARATPGPASLSIGGAEIRLQLEADAFELDEPALRAWVESAARAVESFYGRFPVESVTVKLEPSNGRGVRTGRTDVTSEGLLITVYLGRNADLAALERDWVMTHEMVHLAFPSLPREHNWLSEGLATYVEPIARVEIGALSPEKIWIELFQGLPKGLPQADDRGLDHTPTWGRTYWGGALFCLLADIQIRRRTDNRRGLRDALRAINREGGNMAERWSIDRVIEVGDAATGVGVLRELYEKMRAQPAPVDLDDLWARLGVRRHERHLHFAPDAPLAEIRRAIGGDAEPAEPFSSPRIVR